MGLLTGFNITLPETEMLGQAARAAFSGAVIPGGWSVLTPQQLGVAPQYWDGIYFSNKGASAIVLQRGNAIVVSFRGTDSQEDFAYYPELLSGTYIDRFQPLLAAIAAQAPGDTHFYFTGASLGGGAVNQMADIASYEYAGRFAAAQFVAFASPIISNANGILNVGFENDPIYKALEIYSDEPSSFDNLVFATAQYMAGNYDGRHPLDYYAHSSSASDVFARLEGSAFYDFMSPDSVVIFDAYSGAVTDVTPGREGIGAFYLGEAVADQIIGRAGDDFIEGFGGDDTLIGGARNDRLDGGTGVDSAVFSGLRPAYSLTDLGGGSIRVSGPDGTDTLSGIERLVFDDATVIWPLVVDSVGFGHTDFNGDGKDDLLWRNAYTASVIWEMSGSSPLAELPLQSLSLDWNIAGIRDFDGDSRSDILWRNVNGANGLWEMNADGSTKAQLSVNSLSSDWQVAGVGEFDGDGKADILWRNANGANGLWEMNGDTAKAELAVNSISSDWSVAGIGDFNGDAKSDILWRNANGANGVWLMNGNTATAESGLQPMSTDWKVAGIGDFNGDGRSDIFWRNDNGAEGVWLMNGDTVTAALSINTMSSDWKASGNGDYNGDSRSDILWRNDNGADGMWLMNGNTITAEQSVKTMSPDWHVLG